MTTFPSGGEGERKLQPMRSVAEEDHRRGVTARERNDVQDFGEDGNQSK